jgi:hypothetical protein
LSQAQILRKVWKPAALSKEAYRPYHLSLHRSDVFFRQKSDTFSRSGDAVFELSTRFADPPKMIQEEGQAKQEQLKLLFMELTQVCLWGNATDLSLLINVGILVSLLDPVLLALNSN